MTSFQIALSIVWFAAGFLTNDSESSLQWNRHYAEAKSAAQTTKRPMVVVLENSASIQEKLDEARLSDTDRLILAAEKFELCRVDVSTEYGKLVAEAFGAKQFPYTAVTDDESTRIVFRKSGQMSSADWTLALAKSRMGSDGRVVLMQEGTGSAAVNSVQTSQVTAHKVIAEDGASYQEVAPQQVTYGTPVEYATPVYQQPAQPIQGQIYLQGQPMMFAPTYAPSGGTCFT